MLTSAISNCKKPRQTASFQSIITQMCTKISQISELKAMICEKMINQQGHIRTQQKVHGRQFKLASETSQLFSFIKTQFSPQGIKSMLSEYWTRVKLSSIEIAHFYENQITKCKNYYEAEVWDLREQIKRQYKVIALMKQQVQDLMVLMKYKEGENFNDSSLENMQQYEDVGVNQVAQQTRIKSVSGDSKNLKIRLGNNMRLSDLGNYQRDLEVIEEETQRTLQSSERSNGNNNEQLQRMNNYIKIQEQCENNVREVANCEINQKSNQKKSEKLEFESQSKAKAEIFALDIDDYTAEITPKHTDRVQKIQHDKFENQSQKSLPINNTSNRSVFENSENYYYHSSSNLAQDKPITSGRRSVKLHTAPSDDRKTDHLQSIFFLDDEPDDYLNKTAKLKMMGQKLSFFQSHKNNAGIKSLQHSQLTHSQQEQYALIDDFGNRRIGQVHLKTSQNCQSQGDYDIKYSNDNSKQIQDLFINNERKVSKTARQFNQEETSQYIFKKFNKMVPINYFEGSASVPVSSCSNGPLEQISDNINFDKDQRKSLENKPKTKQFLQQFRKTFNKCLKSMQVSKKHSTKIANGSMSKHGGKSGSSYSSEPQNCHGSGALASGVMTFGKNSGNSSNYSSNSHTHNHHIDAIKDKENHQRQPSESPSVSSSSTTVKAVDNMLKELENNNKFLIGSKKLELKYQGDKKNNVRWGQGVLYYSNGLCYEGQFVNGCRHGYGLLKFNHIEIYNGDWRNDQMEGQGKIRNCAIINKRKTIYSSQTPLGKWISYSGEFRNSKFEGSGTLYLQGGQKFVGHFQNGYAVGQGSLYKKNGEVELGNWRNNFQCDVPVK